MPKALRKEVEQHSTQKIAANAENFPDAHKVAVEKRAGSNHPGQQWTAKIIDRRIELVIPQMPGNPNVVDAVNVNLMKTRGAEPDELKPAAQSCRRKEPAGNILLLCGRTSAVSPIFI